MKALTICEPYASLICLPESDSRFKRVENRTWPAPKALIGQDIAIHAGRSKKYIAFDHARLQDISYGIHVANMPFGKVVAVARLLTCLPHSAIVCGAVPLQFQWLKTHVHSEGPWCWVLSDVRPLAEPIEAKGKQGIWEWTPPEGFAA